MYAIRSYYVRGHVACRILTQHGFTCYNLSGGYRLWSSIYKKALPVQKIKGINNETMVPVDSKPIEVNACGLQCPGPIMKLSEAVKNAKEGETIEIKTTDPAFASDVEAWCRRTSYNFV